MDPDAHLLKFCHGGADIDGITSEPVEPGHDKYIASFYPVDELGEPFVLRDRHRPGNVFRDNSIWLDAEARCLDFPNLVFRGLFDG